jgi:RHS repeat-associated protein
MTIGLGGWSPSIVHHYDSAHALLYYGNGDIRNIQAVSTASGYYATDQAGSEVYYFNSQGIHTQTNDALTGVVKYKFTYTTSGQISTIADLFGNTTRFVYSAGQVQMSSPYGQVTRITLDAAGHLSSVTNPNGETYSVVSNSAGFLQNFTKPAGQMSTVTYSNGLVVAKDQGAGGDFLSFTQNSDLTTGVQTVISSTALSRMTTYKTSANKTSSSHSIQSPFGAVLTYANQDIGSNTSTDQYGNVSSYVTANDPRFGVLAPFTQSSNMSVPNSPIQISSQTSKTAVLSDAQNPLSLTSLTSATQIQNDPTRVFTVNYQASSRTSRSVSAENRTFVQKLNANGQPSSFQVGALLPLNFTYDAHGRLTQSSQGIRNTKLSYDQFSNIASSTDALGRTTRFAYDGANRVIRQIRPDGSIVAMTWDGNGNLTSITPPGRPKHEFQYNLMELVSSYMPPVLSATLTGATEYSYNLDQQLTQVVRPDGSVVTYNYGVSSGLLGSVAIPTGNLTYSYFPNSDLVKSIVSPDGISLDYQYAGDFMTAESTSGAIQSSVQFHYLADSNLGQLVVSDHLASASVNFNYDKDGLLSRAGDEDLSRNGQGDISGTKIGSITESVSYNSYGEVTEDVFKDKGKKNIFDIQYDRDGLGRVAAIRDNEHSTTFEYDSQGRLYKTFEDGHLVRTYNYDQNGNRLSLESRGKTTKGTYDNQDRLLTYGDLEFHYDANGNLIEKVEHEPGFCDRKPLDKIFVHEKIKRTTYATDALGNLKTLILPDGKRIDYLVDGLGRRIAKKVNGKLVQGFVYQTNYQIAAELNGSGDVVRRFVYGSKPNIPDYVIADGKKFRLVSDRVGTPKLLIDVLTGRIAERYDFDEFGVQMLPEARDKYPNIVFGFAGGLVDYDTGLLRFGSRDYDPETGRWLSKDPILFGGGDTNLFGYVANNPVNDTDMSGLASDCTRPLSFLDPLQAGYVSHEFVCYTGSDGKQHCGGLGPKNGFSGSLGGPGAIEPDSPNSSCKDQGKGCMDKCVEQALNAPAPNYNLFGSNCHDFARNVISQCKAQCGGK